MSDETNEEASDVDDQTPPISLGSGLSGLGWLLLSPGHGLTLLFAPSWPHFVVTLIMLHLAIPTSVALSGDPSAGLGQVFIFLNKQFPLTPEAFKLYVFFISAFGLVTSVLLFAILQKVIFVFQKHSITLIDSLAAVEYATFPLFLAVSVKYAHIALTHSEMGPVLFAIWTALLIVAVIWGACIWLQAAKLMTELPLTKLVASGFLIVVCPMLFILIGLAIHFYFVYSAVPSEEELFKNLDYLKDSLKYDATNPN